ncbi:MAG TPA: GAF domain-containing protein, partial [Kofleriaceae bacterium]|nr:GAF domain-containing protein [Kofleriaceae bacterium]
MSEHSAVDDLQAEVSRLRLAHEATERRLRASHAVARVLAEETSLAKAMPRILSSLAHALGASLATFWVPQDGVLVTHSLWAEERHLTAWETSSRSCRFKPGEGLPGRVWKSRGPVWIDDIASGERLPRDPALRTAQIKSGFGFPVTAGNEVCGVVDLFTSSHEPADDHLVEVLRAIGGHLGQFMLHLHMQEDLR